MQEEPKPRPEATTLVQSSTSASGASPSSDIAASSAASQTCSECERIAQNVFVFVDGSLDSDRALRSAIQEARTHGNSRLVIAHVIEPIATAAVVPDVGAAMAGTYVALHQAHQSAKEQGRRILQKALQLAFSQGLEGRAEAHLLESSSSAKDAAVQFLKDRKADVAFVGSRGLGAFGRFLLGSFSDHLVHNAPCSVMVVRPTAEDK